MRVGYGRTSTLEQQAGLEAQERELRAAGCDEVLVEQLSATALKRPRLDEALRLLRKGDEFVVTRPDRLARSVADLLAIEQTVAKRGASLTVLSMGIRTNDATGKLMLQVLGAVAEFERALMLERQREGIAKAKAEGRYKGRPPSVDVEQVRQLKAEGIGPAEIARRLGIGRASVYRALGGGSD